MKLTTFIAGRYLFARKSHNVINVISMISAAGIAVGCMALVIILSIYNGFDDIIRSRFDTTQSDLEIVSTTGKSFTVTDSIRNAVYGDASVGSVFETVRENAFAQYDTRQGIIVVCGVDSVFERLSGVRDYIVSGEFSLHKGQIAQAYVGAALAQGFGIGVSFLTPMYLYFPQRGGDISLVNPMESLNWTKVFPTGTFSYDQTADATTVYIPIENARELFSLDSCRVTALEVNAVAGESVDRLQKRLISALGEGFSVRNRYQQNESLYKVLVSEKLVIYLILIFVMMIISCNVFSSLSMLIIEKDDDIATFRAMGADEKMIRRIFVTEGWMICLMGIAVGVVLGVAVSLVQQIFSVVKMPGSFIVDAYPVLIQWQDILFTVAGVGLIGFLISRLPLLFFKEKAK